MNNFVNLTRAREKWGSRTIQCPRSCTQSGVLGSRFAGRLTTSGRMIFQPKFGIALTIGIVGIGL